MKRAKVPQKASLQGLPQEAKRHVMSYLDRSDKGSVHYYNGVTRAKKNVHLYALGYVGEKDVKDRLEKIVLTDQGRIDPNSWAGHMQRSARREVLSAVPDIQLYDWLWDDTGKDLSDIPYHTTIATKKRREELSRRREHAEMAGEDVRSMERKRERGERFKKGDEDRESMLREARERAREQGHMW